MSIINKETEKCVSKMKIMKKNQMETRELKSTISSKAITTNLWIDFLTLLESAEGSINDLDRNLKVFEGEKWGKNIEEQNLSVMCWKTLCGLI